MDKFIGVVHRSDVEGGHWVLRTDVGVVYLLKGGDSGLHKEGQRVEVEGCIATEEMGIAMLGDILEVSEYRALE